MFWSSVGGDTAAGQRDTVRRLYAEVFVEPPYHDGPAEVERFAAGWPRLTEQPGFRLVIAHRDGDPIGFTFGHEFGVETLWWKGAVTAMPAGMTDEHPGRTFVIIEIAVRQPYRRRGVAGQLHTHLIPGLSVERTTLLVLPEAGRPRRADETWGYRQVGRIRAVRRRAGLRSDDQTARRAARLIAGSWCKATLTCAGRPPSTRRGRSRSESEWWCCESSGSAT